VRWHLGNRWQTDPADPTFGWKMRIPRLPAAGDKPKALT
jgi:hypothetical protein